jgi:pimeloyl-ACP methyl ester carboxylesterase
VLEYEDLQNVVLVGHSYGGMVISGVAERMARRIERLVYLDAFVPRDGEAQIDIMLAPARASLERFRDASSDGTSVPPLPGSNPLLAPQPWRCFTERLQMRNPAAAALPRTYVRCTADKPPGEFMQQSFAVTYERVSAAGWPIVEIATGHSISADPLPKVEALLQIVSESAAVLQMR